MPHTRSADHRARPRAAGTRAVSRTVALLEASRPSKANVILLLISTGTTKVPPSGFNGMASA